MAQEEQERIRKRIREDVKDAITAHSEYAENTLPRLKRNYLKKCQEVEVRSPPHAHSARCGGAHPILPYFRDIDTVRLGASYP